VRVSTKYVPMLFGLKDNLASVRSRIDGLGQGEGK
jgi:hypothetical protein